MAGIDSHSHDRTFALTPSGVVTVLRLRGEIDLASCPDLDNTLRANGDHLVVDLREVTLLSAAAIGVLVAHAQRLADNGGHLRSITGNGAVRRMLQFTRADQVLTSYEGPAAAAIGQPSTSLPAHAPLATNDSQLRSETLRLRRQLRTQPTIGRAMGMLQERYRLRDGDTAFGLLKASSQQHNVRLYVLAEAFVTAPRPHSPTNKSWFPGRMRRVAPPLSCASHRVAGGTNRTAVLDALLHAAMECMDTSGGDLHTLDRDRSDLRLEKHCGLPSEFLHFFAAGNDPRPQADWPSMAGPVS